jgi:hypothetical protein
MEGKPLAIAKNDNSVVSRSLLALGKKEKSVIPSVVKSRDFVSALHNPAHCAGASSQATVQRSTSNRRPRSLNGLRHLTLGFVRASNAGFEHVQRLIHLLIGNNERHQ